MKSRLLGAQAHALAAELEAAYAAPLDDLSLESMHDPGRRLDPADIVGGHGRAGHVDDPIAFGSRDSGRGVLGFHQSCSVLRAALPQGMRTGLSSVHVHVSDHGPAPIGDVVGHRIELVVRWQTGIAGGECVIDATRGSHFTVGGVHSVEIEARSVDPGPPFDFAATDGQTKVVEAVVHWNGAVSPKPCWIVSERIALAAGIVSLPIAIPAQAESLLVLSTVPAGLPALTASFLYSLAVGAPIAFATLDPNANGTPITGGVEAVTFLSPVDMIIQPTWESYL